MGFQDPCLLTAGNKLKATVDDLPPVWSFGPEVDPVDTAVSQPETLVMRVILSFAGNARHHGVASGHNRSRSRAQGEKDWLVITYEIIGGKGIASDKDLDFVRRLFEINSR